MGRLLEREALLAEVAARRRQGARVVFTNGCFDLLHPGHISLLEQSRALGDLLVVAVNSDPGQGTLRLRVQSQGLYCSSLTCSIQSTTLPSSFS